MQIEKINSQSGLVLILASMWVFTLTLIMVFGICLIKYHIDANNPVVSRMMEVLIGTAFGSVNGALFVSMTGSSSTSVNTSTPTQPYPTENNALNQATTQGNAIPAHGINHQIPTQSVFP